MYGTVMIGQLAEGVTVEQLKTLADDWRQARPGIGFVDERALRTDDGRVVVVVRFESKDAYMKIADDPGQDEWWTNVMRPLLAADPEWVDGDWVYEA